MALLKIKNTENQWTDIYALRGEPGDKPVKGTDYFTEADIDELVQEIMTRLGAPQLFAPAVIMGDDSVLTIVPSPDNGAFEVYFGLYSDGRLIQTYTDTIVDLKVFEQPNKFETLTLRALGSGFLPSEAVESGFWGYEWLILTLEQSVISFQNIAAADIYSVYVNNEKLASIPNPNEDIVQFDLKDLNLDGGEHSVYIIGWRQGVEIAHSNEVVYAAGMLEEPEVYIEDHIFRIYDEQAEADTYTVFANNEPIETVPAMINLTFKNVAPRGFTSGHSSQGIMWEPRTLTDHVFPDVDVIDAGESVTVQVPYGTQFFLENKWTVRAFGDYTALWGNYDYELFTCYSDCVFEMASDTAMNMGGIYDLWQ